MNYLQIEALERRTFLSSAPAVNSVHAVALGTTDIIDSESGEENISGNIHVTWTRAASTPINGYRVFESFDNQNYDQVGEVTGNTFVDTQLDVGVTYFYRVRPFTRAGGNLASLGTASAITNLPTPGGELFALSDHHIGFDFFDDSIHVLQFKVEWAPVGGKFTAADSMLITSQLEGGAEQDSFCEGDATNLDPTVEYQFRATAFSDIKVSTPFTDEIFPLPAPENVTQDPFVGGTTEINWTSNSKHATGYRVEWTRDGDDSPMESQTVGRNARGLVLRDLQEDAHYTVQVFAIEGKFENASDQIDATSIGPIDRLQNGFGAELFTGPKNASAVGSDVAIQNGKPLVIGTSNHNFQVFRFNTDGSPDTTFNKTGDASIDFGGDDVAHSVALTPDGKIAVVGTSNGNWAIAELNADGSLDRSFDSNGLLEHDFSAPADAWNIASDSNGNDLYIAGLVQKDGENRATILRLLPDGQLDPDWKPPVISHVAGKNTVMAVQPDGNVILACLVSQGIVIARFNSDGTPDMTFGARGRSTFRFSASAEQVYGLTIQADGKIVLAGSKGTGAHSAFAVARLTAKGELDTSFNQSGVVATSFGKNSRASAQDVAVLPNGNIMVAGGAVGDFAIAEYNPDGSLDKNFNGIGTSTFDFGSSHDIAAALALADDGSIYAAGTSGNQIAAAHFFVQG